MPDHRLSARFGQTGLKLTAPRREVIRLLEKKQSAHLGAEEVHAALRAQGVRINLSSVYRTLNLLVALGLVHRIDLSESHVHFGLEHGTQAHFRCEVCGEVTEVFLAGHTGLAQHLQGLARKHSFELTHSRIEAEGRCKRCASKEKRHRER